MDIFKKYVETQFLLNIKGKNYKARLKPVFYKSWILGNVTRIPRHELPQTLDFSDFLPLFT